MSLIKNIIKTLLYLIFLPIWVSQRVFSRRSKNIWIFGCWYGQKYSDNSKYLFEYVNLNEDNEIRPIWITRNKEVLNHVKDMGLEVYMAHSMKAIYYTLLCEYIFISSGKKDVNSLYSNGAKLVQLWHGSPLKRIGLDDEYSSAHNFFNSIITKNLAPYWYEYNYHYTVTNSETFQNIFSSAFAIEKDNVLNLGSPRNDIFFSKKKHLFNQNLINTFGENCKIIYYLPTYRDQSKFSNMFELPDFDANELLRILERNNIVFVYKGHFVDSVWRNSFIKRSDNNRFIIIDESVDYEISEMYKDADLLITDYSSVFYDFLLTQKPIVFAAYDLDDYLSHSRKMYFPYEQIVPGPIVGNWKELFELIEGEIWEINPFLDKLKNANKIYNKFHDVDNSERVYNFFK